MDNRLKRNHLGFLEIDEKPTSAELQEHYASQYYQAPKSATYQTLYSPEELDRLRGRAELRRIAAMNQIRIEISSMLDVGCGEGWALGAFFDAGWTVRGIDFSEFGVSTQNPRLREFVTVGDVYAILDEFISKGDRFGVVNLAHVLEHVLDPIELLRRLHSVVMPGGLLVVSVPNDGNALHEELFASGKISHRWWIAPPEHLNYFTADSLRRTASATGWNLVDLWGDFPVDWFLVNEHSNYVDDKSLGAAAHASRLVLERHIAASGPEREIPFWRALGGVGLGRSMIAFLQPARGEG